MFDFDFFGDSDSLGGLEYGERISFWLQQREVPFISIRPNRARPKLRVRRHWLESVIAKMASSSSGSLSLTLHVTFYNV